MPERRRDRPKKTSAIIKTAHQCEKICMAVQYRDKSFYFRSLSMPVLEGYWQASIRARLKSKNRSPTVQTPEIKFWGSRDRMPSWIQE